MKRSMFFPGASVFLLSGLVIAYQIALMNALSFISFSLFTELIISIALLGFGASGAFLTFISVGKLKNTFLFISLLFAGLVVSLPGGYIAALKILPDIQHILYGSGQVFRFLMYIFCFFVPFFLCASIIGTVLSLYSRWVHILYGANLGGSGIGGILALFLLMYIKPEFLPLRLTVFALSAWFLWIIGETGGGDKKKFRRRILPVFVLMAAGFASAALSFIIRPDIKPDPNKTISYVSQLEVQGRAEKVWEASGPSGVFHIYKSELFHDALFASPVTPHTPPKQMLLLHDGERTGTVFLSGEDTGILRYTPQSLPYRLVQKPRVLLLDENGGTNVLLGRMFEADSVTVVQQNRELVRIWKEVLPGFGIDYFSMDGVFPVRANPRLFLTNNSGGFDIIHIAGAEGMPGSHGGLYSSRENYLLTREGLRDCFALLSSRGCIVLTRGLQSPPRDNLKILSLCNEVLSGEGAADPENHILQAKNYLAATTMLFRDPLDENTIAAYLTAVEELQMDSEWHPGIITEEISQKNIIPGPPGSAGSYLHYGAKEIFSGRGSRFAEEYIYNIEAPADNKPYFNHFFTWRSFDVLRKTDPAMMLRSSEAGYLLLLLTLGAVLTAAFLLVLAPSVVQRMRSRRRGGFRILLMFPLIGAGFMFIEIAMIRKLGILLEMPVFSITSVISSMLVFSGAGALVQNAVKRPPEVKIRWAGAAVFFLLGVSLTGFALFFNTVSFWKALYRFLAAFLFTAPVSFFLGWFFASGISALTGATSADDLPMAWGLNGFASVAAVPLAALLAMRFGFNMVLLCAMILYILTGISTFLWRRL